MPSISLELTWHCTYLLQYYCLFPFWIVMCHIRIEWWNFETVYHLGCFRIWEYCFIHVVPLSDPRCDHLSFFLFSFWRVEWNQFLFKQLPKTNSKCLLKTENFWLKSWEIQGWIIFRAQWGVRTQIWLFYLQGLFKVRCVYVQQWIIPLSKCSFNELNKCFGVRQSDFEFKHWHLQKLLHVYEVTISWFNNSVWGLSFIYW